MTAAERVPLVPVEVDLRDFAFLPLEGRRLLTSETWILGTPDERCAALALWIESWHQLPAASLPANDRILAHLSQAGARWPRVKAHALRGWVAASDGRLYHPVLAEKALDAWARKQAQRDRTAAARAARHQHRLQQTGEPSATSSVTEPVTGSKGQGQGQQTQPPRAARSASGLNGAFAGFWDRYPKKRSKGQAEKAWLRLKPDADLQARIAAALDLAKASPDWQRDGGQYIPHPATWLNARGWEDAHEATIAAVAGSWWKTDDGVIAKATELRVPRGNDHFTLFRARVLVAAGDGPWLDPRDVTTFRLVEQLRGADAHRDGQHAH